MRLMGRLEQLQRPQRRDEPGREAENLVEHVACLIERLCGPYSEARSSVSMLMDATWRSAVHGMSVGGSCSRTVMITASSSHS